MKITMENQFILKRLQEQQSYYNKDEWEGDFKKREKILKVMCEYPYQLANSKLGAGAAKSEQASYNDLSQYKSNNNSVIIEQI